MSAGLRRIFMCHFTKASLVRFEVPTAMDMKMAAFWSVVSRSQVHSCSPTFQREEYIKTDRDCFLQNPSQFIIHNPISRYINYELETVSLHKSASVHT